MFCPVCHGEDELCTRCLGSGSIEGCEIELEEITTALCRVNLPQAVDCWLHRHNDRLGFTPYKAIMDGDENKIARIWAMINRLESGQPG